MSAFVIVLLIHYFLNMHDACTKVNMRSLAVRRALSHSMYHHSIMKVVWAKKPSASVSLQALRKNQSVHIRPKSVSPKSDKEGKQVVSKCSGTKNPKPSSFSTLPPCGVCICVCICARSYLACTPCNTTWTGSEAMTIHDPQNQHRNGSY